ncbi:MAG: hypothetical protein L6Q92_03630 [Phycisphaerae bacterium]|nr:hypothetical protein [Phycisphaerae bacterium]
MGFLAGSASFTRFSIVGGAPKRLDAALLEKLSEHGIGRQREMRSDRVEAGWIGGDHILDRAFSEAKNFIGDAIHVALRIDTARVPPEIMRAYVRMELEALQRGREGRAVPAARQRQAAREAAQHRAETEIRQGRFHRMRQFPVLIDGCGDTLLIAASAESVFEHLHPLYRETFGKRLELITAGRLAYRLAELRGASRAVEQATPAPFVKNPEGDGSAFVYWTMHDPASRDFLGNEFLIWLWWHLAERSDTIALGDKSDAAVVIVKQLVLECPWARNGRTTIVCDGPARLPEAHRAIRGGKLPRRAGLVVSREGRQYEFSLSADSMRVSSAVLPTLEGEDEASPPMPADRVEQVRHLIATIDLLFDAFLSRRTSSAWSEDFAAIVRWLKRVE